MHHQATFDYSMDCDFFQCRVLLELREREGHHHAEYFMCNVLHWRTQFQEHANKHNVITGARARAQSANTYQFLPWRPPSAVLSTAWQFTAYLEARLLKRARLAKYAGGMPVNLWVPYHQFGHNPALQTALLQLREQVPQVLVVGDPAAVVRAASWRAEYMQAATSRFKPAKLTSADARRLNREKVM
jgi:hypothetical protein